MPVDWTVAADLAPQVRGAFDPECLAAHDAMTRSRILNALRLSPPLTRPRTVDLDQGVLETVFGSFGPGHAFNAFTPDWGIRLIEHQATQGLKHLLTAARTSFEPLASARSSKPCRFRTFRTTRLSSGR